MSDPAKYRTRDEVNKIRDQSDPIEMARKRIIDRGFSSEDELKRIEKRVREVVTDAADFATDSPEPDAAELWTDIYR
jgi:pyruvate dehydrogenase E1 component subunit alpha